MSLLSSIKRFFKPESALSEPAVGLPHWSQSGYVSPYPPPVWTFDEGVCTARVVERVIRPCGYFTALAGSVLYKGQSFKDLDLLITPLGATPHDEWAARLALCKLNMRKVHECSRGTKYDRSNHRVEVWNDAQGRRIDIFWMNDPGLMNHSVDTHAAQWDREIARRNAAEAS